MHSNKLAPKCSLCTLAALEVEEKLTEIGLDASKALACSYS